MKKFIKIFTYFIGSIIGFVIVLIVTAKLAENKITDIALKKVSESIEAPVVIDNVSFNLLRKFPLATIELENVLLGVPGITNKIDTIFYLNKIYVSVKSKPLLNGEIKIMKIDINGANINYSVDSIGTSNIDFLMTSSDSTETDTSSSKPLDITLTDFIAQNIVCNYNDSLLKIKTKVIIPELKVKAEINGTNILAAVKGKLNISDASFEETNLYLMEKTEVNFDVTYKNDSISLKQLDIITDGANLSILGNVKLHEKIETDVVFTGKELILDELLKYAPAEMLEEYGVQKFAGKLNLNAKIKGNYSELELPRVDIDLDFTNGSFYSKEYPDLKNILFKGKVTNGVLRNNQSTQATFETVHFETDKSKFNINFSILDIDNPKYNLKTDVDINVGEFSDFIPDSLIQFIDGNIKASLSTKGELPDSIADDFVDYAMANTSANIKLIDFNIDLDSSLSVKDFSSELIYTPNNFQVKGLNISIPGYNVNLKNTSLDANFKGSINNTSELNIDLKAYHIETDKSKIKGKAQVTNLDNPSYSFLGDVDLNLDEVKTMLPDTLLNILTGNVMAEIKSSGTINLDSISDQAMDIVFNSSTFKLNFDNVSVEMPDFPDYNLDKLSGEFEMNPEAIRINKMNGLAAGLSFEIDSTEIWNTYKVLIQELNNEMITVQTNIVLGDITNSFIGTLMGSETEQMDQSPEKTNSESVDENSQLNSKSAENSDSLNAEPKSLLPNLEELGVPHFLVRGKIAVNRLEYEKNIIDDISLNFRFTDSLYVVDEFKLKTCGGELNTSLKLDVRRLNKPVVDVKTVVENLDVKQLLLVNDNFGDTSLTHEKISGILTSELKLRAFYVDGDWPTDRIRSEGHFTLENGSIYGYEPLVELSKNKLVGGLKELDKLDFNTLTTSIFMYKDKIYIPKTKVVTSSMDLTAFAMHSMKDDYEYHIKLNLGDVLTGKSEKLLKDQAKQNKLDGKTDDRSGIRLVSLKMGKDKKNGLDNNKLEKDFLKDLNKQQGWLNLLFNPLLVNFSTDLDRTKRNKELIEKYGKKD